jgi:hypothetical protein
MGGKITNTQRLNYIGIPINVKYDFIRTRWINVYAGAGAMAELFVGGTRKEVFTNKEGQDSKPIKDPINADGIQPSVSAMLGVELKVFDFLGIYIEPGVNYYFDTEQPASYRTKNPLNFAIRAGARFRVW